MAAALLPVTAVVQDTFQVSEPAQQQAGTNVTPVNANQAQGASVPADTVTLTNQTAEGQQTGADPDGGQFDRAAFLGAAGAYIGANSAHPNRAPFEPALPALLPQNQTQDAPASTSKAAANTAAQSAAASTANAAANSANSAATDPAAGATNNTPQQQLQQLDHTLQQLGINPDSIPLSSRMAMVLYANDPAALRSLVQAVQGAAQTGLDSQQLDLTAAQTNSSEAEATTAQLGNAIPENADASTQAAQASTLTVQYGELQAAFQSVEIQQGSQQLNGSSNPASDGATLDVTA